MLQSKGSQIGTEQQKCSFREISADQWGKGPDGARNVSSWPPDGARHPQSARAASVRPSEGRAPEEIMCVCVCLRVRSALQRFYTLESSSAEEHVQSAHGLPVLSLAGTRQQHFPLSVEFQSLLSHLFSELELDAGRTLLPF